MRPVLAAAVLAACAGHTDTREAARAVLIRHCGECHLPGTATTQRRALRVFDLGRADFAATMSPDQLRNALWRLGEPFDEHARVRLVLPDDLATFRRFVDEEIGRR